MADDSGPGGPRREQWATVAIALLLFYFALRVAWLALVIDPAIPPDETTHMGRARVYAGALLLPTPGPADHHLGLLTHRPFLYPWLSGKLLAANLLGWDELLLLRFANVLLGLATVVYGIRWIRVVTASPLAQLLFTLLLTNTLMFTGLVAAVSYDNLANLCAAGAIFHLFRRLRDASPPDLAAFTLWLGAGVLAKRSFLPLAVILVLVWTWREGRTWIASASRPPLAALLRAAPVRWSLALLAVTASLLLYGSNLALYGGLVPRLDQVVGEEAAMRNRIHARDHILGAYRGGEVSLAVALAMADAIEHEGDRSSTRNLLRQTRQLRDHRLGALAYARFWGQTVLQRTIGYFGHRRFIPDPWQLRACAALLALSILAYAVGRLRGGVPTEAGWAGAITLAYVLVVGILVNHASYRETGLPGFAVQGRYLFPVIVPLYGLVAVGLTEALPRRAALVAFPVTALLFLYGDLPVFLARAGPHWFGGSSP